MKSVCVLLSTYNGEKFLRPLLDSVLRQEGILLNLVVRDDGSKDGTLEILKEYQQNGKIQKLIAGENVGFVRSFHQLCCNAVPSDYYAFCDQDDVWDKDKLLCAVRRLDEKPRQLPLVYWCAYRSMDKNGKIYKKSSKRLKYRNQYNPLANGLNWNDIRGCSSVFNPVALGFLTGLEEGSYRFHDWMLYLICCAFGEDVYDETPHFSYRSHDSNCYGPPKFSYAWIKRGIKYLKDMEFNHNRSKQAKEFADAFYDRADEKQKYFLDCVLNYRKDKAAKKRLLRCKKEFRALPVPMRWFIKFTIRINKY